MATEVSIQLRLSRKVTDPTIATLHRTATLKLERQAALRLRPNMGITLVEDEDTVVWTIDSISTVPPPKRGWKNNI